MTTRRLEDKIEALKEGTKEQFANMQSDLSEIKQILNSKYVTQDQFFPVKTIAYGIVALICVAVVGAIMTQVLK